MRTQLITRLGLAVLVAASASSCAATVDKDKTYLTAMQANVRVDPPSPGTNNVYFDVRDLTGEGLSDQLFDQVEGALMDRGWQIANVYQEADYVLLADLRLFSEAGTEEGDRRLNDLGAVAAGAAVGVGVAKATDNWWIGGAAGAAAGVGTNILLEKMNRVNKYQMVLDVVLGRKVEGGVERSIESDTNSADSSSAGTSTVVGNEGASSNNAMKMEQDLLENRVHFDLSQRLLAMTQGRRMSKEMAKDELVPRLILGLKEQLPRVRF